MKTSKSIPVSVVILTLNEESNLPACLASVAGFDDVVILDSGSTDNTVAIARAAGARVFTNRFVDFADQRNHAHHAIDFRHPWVLHLDADELVTPELTAELAGLDPAAPFDGYYLAPRMMFHGDWLRHCTDFPAWQARCVRARGFRFIQAGHGQREAPDMKMGFLQESYLHDISIPDEAEWYARHRRYAREEAEQYLASRQPPGKALGQLISGPQLARRRAVKQLSYHFPFRPLLRFLYQYFGRGGFLDGPKAFRYCRLLARYEGLSTAAIKQLKASRHG